MGVTSFYGASGNIVFSRYGEIYEIFGNFIDKKERFITGNRSEARKKVKRIAEKGKEGYYHVVVSDGKFSQSYAGSLDSMGDFLVSIGKRLIEFERSPLVKMMREVFGKKD